MDNQTQERLEYLLDLEADGALGEAERRQLDEVSATLPASGAVARRRAARLHEVLATSRVEVRPGFRQQVLAHLEPAGWEARSLRAWRWPVALMLVLGGLAATLIGSSAAGIAPQSSFLSTFGSLWELLATSLLAGAGLLSASWRGLGLALGDALRGSPAALVAVAVAVIGINALLVMLLRRGRRAHSEATVSTRD